MKEEKQSYYLHLAMQVKSESNNYILFGDVVKKTKIWEQHITHEIMWDGAYFSSSSLLANLQR
jgi:hypothetical protein